MSDTEKTCEQPLVFGLDIGTRNVVGTVGYTVPKNQFIVTGSVYACSMIREQC